MKTCLVVDDSSVIRKVARRILEGLEALKRRSTRRLLGNVRPVALGWLAWLRAQPGVVQAEAAGSLRRWKSTIGDLDLVAACAEPGPVMAAFTSHPDVQRVRGQGENKSSIELKDGTTMQLWIQPPERFGTLLVFGIRLRGLRNKLAVQFGA